MPTPLPQNPWRRRLLGVAAASPLLAAWPLRATQLPPTPGCADGASATAPQTAGPFHTPDSPQRRRLREAGMPGVPLALHGRVRDTDCQPLRGVILDFWQADHAGRYDNAGYRLRGHQRSDDGRYRLETVVPGRYPGRTRHLHVRLQRPDGRALLTTQLYFPDDAHNARDGLFDPSLQMAVLRDRGRAFGAFDFVLPRGALDG